MRDDAARQHVGAVADPRRVVPDRRGGDAKLLQIIEAADAGTVAPLTGIVEDRGGGSELGREIGGIEPAMRGIDDDRAGGLAAHPGDAVGGDDRRIGHGWNNSRGMPALIMPAPGCR